MKKYLLTGLICLSMIIISTAKSEADTEAGQVLAVKKQVHIVQGESRKAAKPQMKLMLKNSVETGKKSRAKLFFTDDSIINLGETSRLVVEEYLYSPEKKRSKSIYRLIDGSLKVVVGRSDLEIHTPTAVAAARGTIIYVKYVKIGGKWFTIIIVTEGEATVRGIIAGKAGKESVLVKAGEMTRVEWDMNPEDVREADLKMLGSDWREDFIIIGDSAGDPGDLPDEGSDQATSESLLKEEGDTLPNSDQQPEEPVTPVIIELDFQRQ